MQNSLIYLQKEGGCIFLLITVGYKISQYLKSENQHAMVHQAQWCRNFKEVGINN